MSAPELAAIRSPALNSLDLIYSGSSAEFIAALKGEIASHQAISHPFLHRLSRGEFGDTLAVLRDYAHQYSFYSSWFTRYLEGVIDNLDLSDHKEILRQNMEEERGIPNSPNLEQRPHVELFQRFKESVGVNQEYINKTEPCTTVLLWRDLFLQKCSSPVKGVGLAAIGLATEYIISSIYPYIIKAIDEYTELGDEASLFFRLHTHCDDDHAEALEHITQEVADDLLTREAIRFGVFSSLNLRSAFWDAQLARAERLF